MAWDFIKENGKVLALNKPSTIEIFYSISNDYSSALVGKQITGCLCLFDQPPGTVRCD